MVLELLRRAAAVRRRVGRALGVTRDYRLELTHAHEQPPLLSVFGGKITTYRRLAETVLEKLQEPLGISPRCWTHRAPLPGGDLPGRHFRRFVIDVRRRWRFLPITVARRLARAYGTRVEAIIGGAQSFADLGEHTARGSPPRKSTISCATSGP